MTPDEKIVGWYAYTIAVPIESFEYPELEKHHEAMILSRVKTHAIERGYTPVGEAKRVADISFKFIDSAGEAHPVECPREEATFVRMTAEVWCEARA